MGIEAAQMALFDDLEAGLDSSLQHEAGYSDEHFHEGDDDDWDDDDDVEVIYVRE